ncbi:hypothetical protein LMG19282_05243 [Cupriavidus campinensis]|nr:hypothetical protein LMG19282_05243 [Cupriavidus campinensis]
MVGKPLARGRAGGVHHQRQRGHVAVVRLAHGAEHGLAGHQRDAVVAVQRAAHLPAPVGGELAIQILVERIGQEALRGQVRPAGRVEHLHMQMGGAPGVPAGIDRAEHRHAIGAHRLAAAQEGLAARANALALVVVLPVVLAVVLPVALAVIARVHAGGVAMPEIHAMAGQGAALHVHHGEAHLQRHAGLAFGDVLPDLARIEVIRALGGLGGQGERGGGGRPGFGGGCHAGQRGQAGAAQAQRQQVAPAGDRCCRWWRGRRVGHRTLRKKLECPV